LRTRAHSHGPVPFALAGAGIRADKALEYSEIAGTETGLVVDPGHQLMEKALNLNAF